MNALLAQEPGVKLVEDRLSTSGSPATSGPAAPSVVPNRTPVFAKDTNGHTPRYYLPITLVNNQNSETPERFQCLLIVNSGAYSSYEASNLANINFQVGDGRTILDSWLESGETSSSTATIYWVVLPQPVAGFGGQLTVYIVFYGTSQSSKDGRATGTEPTWAGGAYAQYDNGSRVFEYYQAFGGLPGGSVPNGWTRSPGYVTVTNEVGYTNVTFTSTTFDGAVYASSTPPSVTTYPTVIEGRAGFPTGGVGDAQAGYAQVIGDFDSSVMAGSWAGTAMIGSGRADHGVHFFWGSGSGDHFPYTETSQPTDPNVHVFTLNIDSKSLNSLLIDYKEQLRATGMSSRPTHSFGAYGGASLPGYGQINLYWLRTRLYPPSTTFPTPRLGGVTAIGSPGN